MKDISFQSQEEKIRNFERGHRAIDVINIGLKFGIFRALGGHREGATPQDLAFEMMLHEPYLKVWLQTAYHFDILDCNDQGRFRLQSHLDEILGIQVSHSPAAMAADGSTLMENPEGQESLLFNFIRTGRPVGMERSPESSLATAEATKSVHMVFFTAILPENPHLERMLRKGIKFLDIGCGGGILLIELAHAFDGSRFVGIDPDIYGVQRAENSAERFGLDERVSFEDLGAEELTFQGEFDLISMVATLHEIPPEIRGSAMEKVHRALKNNGYLLVLDFPYPDRIEDFRNPRYNYGVIEQYYEVTRGIVHLNAREQDDLLSRAGFRNIKRRDVNQGMFDFIMASK